jgi:hypothetical protein
MPNDPRIDPDSRFDGQATLPANVADATQRSGRLDPSGEVLGQADHSPARQFDIGRARRCGVPDFAPGDLRPTAYGSPGGRWTRGNLTYSVNVGTSGVTPATVEPVMKRATDQWSAAQPFFTFTRVPPGPADIRVQVGGPELDSTFGPVSGVSGSAHYPELGDVYLDTPYVSMNLLTTLLHELGHALGLRHSTNPASLMYPFGNGTVIDGETLRAIQDLYGWLPQVPLTDRGSVERPALAVAGPMSIGAAFSGTLYMAWRGVAGDDDVYWSHLDDGDVFSPQQKIEGIGSAHGPCLASGFMTRRDGSATNGLFMAWDGVPGDDAIYFAQNPDPAFSAWPGQQRIDGVGTSDRPALAYFNGAMRMAWKGIPGDSTIYWSTFDGSGWSPQQAIPGRGTSHGPSLVMWRDRLYMFWKGVDDDTRVFYAWIGNSSNSIWQAQREVVFSESQTAGIEAINIGTTHAPAATVRGDRIVLAWKGIPGDTGLYFATLEDNGEWSGQVRVPDVGTSHGPAVADLEGRLYMAWKGIPGDSGLYYSRLG